MTQPLAGRTILVTRPAHQAGALSQAIRDTGGHPFEFPALAIEAVPAVELHPALAALAAADDVIFISPNAANFGMAAIAAHGGLPARARVYAVGAGTARALADRGVTGVITPAGQDSEALLALPQLQQVAGHAVTIVRGVGGRALLAETLAARAAHVGYLECYRRAQPQADATPLRTRWQAGDIDAVTIASAETLHNLRAMLGETADALLRGTPLFVPHEKIAAAARQLGVETVIATGPGEAGLVDGLINWFRNHP